MRISFRPMLAVLLWASLAGGLAGMAGCERVDATASKEAPPAKKKKWDTVEKSANPSAPQSKSAAQKKTDSSAREVPAKAKQAAPVSVPPDEIDALRKYLQKLDTVRLEEDTREARAAFIEVQQAMVKAADKLLAKPDLKEEIRFEAIAYKWSAASLLVGLDVQGAEARFLALANEMVDDKNPIVARTARLKLRQLDVVQSLVALIQGKPANTEKLMQDLNAILGEDALGYAQYDLLEKAAKVLESKEKFDEAAKIYAGTEKAFRALGDAELAAEAAFHAQQATTRLGWIGKPAELAGTRLDGKPFDLSELKGKVVLIDFWATWCPPCLEELPNLVENYKKYRDRGFEVVGVSLDFNKDDLERFVAGENPVKQKLDWVTLFWSEGTERLEPAPYDDPLAQRYGVDSVPSTFLVDQSGKVISLGIRGKRLGERLEELLGAPDETPEEEDKQVADKQASP